VSAVGKDHQSSIMTKVHINIGSNVNKEKNIALAINALKENFGEIQESSIFKSKAIGFEGDDFFNIGLIFSQICNQKN